MTTPSRLIPDAPLLLRVAVEPISHAGARLDALIDLVNTASTPVVVCRRLLINECTSPPSVRELCFSVEGPPGYINTRRFAVRAGPPATGDFGQLAPGEAHSKLCTLGDYQSLHLPGEYSLTARYTNYSAVQIGGVAAWVGEVVSAPVRFIRAPN